MYFSFISIYLQYTGENASYLSLCLCVSIFHRKIKMQNKFKSQGEMVPGSSMATCLLPARSLRYSIEMLLLFLCSLWAEEINHVWEQACPILGSNLTSEECHYTPSTLPAKYYLSWLHSCMNQKLLRSLLPELWHIHSLRILYMLSTKCKQNVQTTSNHLAGVWMYGVGKVVVGGKENKNTIQTIYKFPTKASRHNRHNNHWNSSVNSRV